MKCATFGVRQLARCPNSGSSARWRQDRAASLGLSPPQPFVLPVGQITHVLGLVMQAKIMLFSPPPNQRYKPPVSSLNEGRWPSSRTLGWDAVDAAVSGVNVIAGRIFRERFTARRRTALFPRLRKNFGGGALSAEALGEAGSRTAKPCGSGTRCWCQVGGGFCQPNRA